jgi:FlaA1/EpsC-like NDP-sugar epimerase
MASRPSRRRGLDRSGTRRLTGVAQAAARMRADLPFLCLDLGVLGAAYGVFLLLRFDGSIPQQSWWRFEHFVPVALALHILIQWACGLYGRIWEHAGVQEARRIVLACAAGLVAVIPLSQMSALRIPLSVAVLGCVVGTMFVGTSRFEARLFALRRRDDYLPVTRVVVVGAGDAGAMVLREMLDHREAGHVPVAVLDDDPRKKGRTLLGVPVMGGSGDLVSVVERVRANLVLLAVPNAPGELIGQCAAQADIAGVPVKLLRPSADWMQGRSMRDARAVGIDDLLGRDPVDIDLAAIDELCRGKRILITGAGGSIGAEISRQVSRFDPEVLVLLDHDETHLHDLMCTLSGNSTPVLSDIRNRRETERIFMGFRPDLVFHAAAHKHVPLLESHPAEAVRTNVVGTRNIVEAARAAQVRHLVFISTDKAVRPANVLGHSKRIGEQLVLGGAPADSAWCAVRFGNVLGSRGSVIPTFLRQIAEGGPVTVTDPRMTRYFMSIPEAVRLVLQATAMSGGGEIFMLDMGQPVRILDVAERLIRLSGRAVGDEVEVRITGMRPGEKLAEELTIPDERGCGTAHRSIVRLEPQLVDTDQLLVDISRLAQIADDGEPLDIARELQAVSSGVDIRDRVFEISPGIVDIDGVDLMNEGNTWNSATI